MTPASLRALLEGATKGPWYADGHVTGDGSVVMSESSHFRVAHLVANHEADAEMIAALRNKGDALVALWEATAAIHDDETCIEDRAEDCSLCMALAALKGMP